MLLTVRTKEQQEEKEEQLRKVQCVGKLWHSWKPKLGMGELILRGGVKFFLVP